MRAESATHYTHGSRPWVHICDLHMGHIRAFKAPKIPRAVREEIKRTCLQAANRGDAELSVADLDSMKYLMSLVKETLRYHPIILLLNREAGHDDIIPLSVPQKLRTGETITAIPVSKGKRVILSIAAYQRIKSVWGEGANEWRPERYMDGTGTIQRTGVGVLSNIHTISSGIRGCVGWRFAMIQMQAILAELIENFEFSPPPGNVEILRSVVGAVAPV
ncbi:cytochrome P450 [Ramaria rubella]|nr:cytochrome P450 [Ramaria rubella]